MDERTQARNAMVANGLSPDEIERVMLITASLYDGGPTCRLQPASEVSSDAITPALTAALADDTVCDWRIVVVGSVMIPDPHLFLTDSARKFYIEQCHGAFLNALRDSCDGNIIRMIAKTLPRGILLPTGCALPPLLEYARGMAVGACFSEGAPPDADDIRIALLSTYLDVAMHSNAKSRTRLERIADCAARKAIPYGLRKAEPRVKPTFLCFGA